MKELLSIGIIGTGNCGGQFADAATAMGFDAIAVNASQDDLNALKNEGTSSWLVGDGNGTGKNRDEAKNFLMERTSFFKDEKIIKFATSHDVCVVVTSIGGGFGSGTSLEIVRLFGEIYPNKLFIPAGVMPFNDETFTAQEHSIQWLQDLEALNLSYFLYDDDRFAGEKEQVVAEKVCNDFLMDMRIMRGDFVAPTVTGGVDPRDLLTVYSTPGRIVSAGLVNIDDDDLVEKSLVKTVKKYIDDKSAHADLTDDKQILASATMYYLPDSFDPYKSSVRSDLQELYGSHVGDYANFADMTDTGEDVNGMEPCIAIALAGLSAPQARIGKLVKRRDQLATDITSRKTQESKVSGIGRLNSDKLKLTSKSFGNSEGSAPKIDADQILADYCNASDSRRATVASVNQPKK